jgi:hypothetical protein
MVRRVIFAASKPETSHYGNEKQHTVLFLYPLKHRRRQPPQQLTLIAAAGMASRAIENIVQSLFCAYCVS